MTDPDAESQEGEQQNEGHPDCEMPRCLGSPDDELKAVRDPSHDLVEMCEGCIDAGWGVGEVVE